MRTEAELLNTMLDGYMFNSIQIVEQAVEQYLMLYQVQDQKIVADATQDIMTYGLMGAGYIESMLKSWINWYKRFNP